MGIFQAVFLKIGVALGSRALSFALFKLGLPGGALLMTFFVKVLITEGASQIGIGPQMMATGSADSGNSSSGGWTSLLGSTAQQPSVVPSGGSLSGGWTRFDEDVLLEADSGASSSGHSNSNPSINQPQPGEQAMPPANPVASGEAEAGPAHVLPFPYDEREVIGGDSVLSIQSRLLAKYAFPSAEQIEWARIEAQDRFEIKVDIIRLMAPLNPEGDWERRGARALDNPRTATGEESLERLYHKLEDLQNGGLQSETFRKLVERVPRRANNDSQSIT